MEFNIVASNNFNIVNKAKFVAKQNLDMQVKDKL